MRPLIAPLLLLALSWLAAAPASAEDVMTVQGTELLRNGEPFEVHGVQIMAVVAPIEYLEDPPVEACNGREPPCPFKVYVAAHEAFGPALLDRAGEFGANTILVKVSSLGLDPKDPLHSAGYVDDVVHVVNLARDAGFVVIVSLQETAVAGDPGPRGSRTPIPDQRSLRAAVKLAELFGDDPGIMIEPAVEPFAPGRRRKDFWRYYVEGGDGYPGMNAIIAAMRDAGSRNVVIVEAIGQNFGDFPGGIVDPLDQILYGVHTYFNMVGTTREEWDKRFGKFAERHPMLVTEWNQNSYETGARRDLKPDWCKEAPMTTPLEMLHYFDEKGLVGVVAWSFDLPTTFVADMKGTPRSLEGFACGERGGGIGDLFQAYFRGDLPPLPAR
jgi:hypothetical protein